MLSGDARRGRVTRGIMMPAAAVLAIAVGILPAGAVPPPIAGSESCAISGTLTLKRPLTNTASAKPIKVKGVASASSCNSASQTGGKGPITGAAIKIIGSLPAGASCTTLINPVFLTTKVQAKWLYTNTRGKPATDGVDNTLLANAVLVNANNPVEIQFITLTLSKGPFVGQTITLNLALDDHSATLLGECGGTGITSLAFGSVNASSITSP